MADETDRQEDRQKKQIIGAGALPLSENVQDLISGSLGSREIKEIKVGRFLLDILYIIVCLLDKLYIIVLCWTGHPIHYLLISYPSQPQLVAPLSLTC